MYILVNDYMYMEYKDLSRKEERSQNKLLQLSPVKLVQILLNSFSTLCLRKVVNATVCKYGVLPKNVFGERCTQHKLGRSDTSLQMVLILCRSY